MVVVPSAVVVGSRAFARPGLAGVPVPTQTNPSHTNKAFPYKLFFTERRLRGYAQG